MRPAVSPMLVDEHPGMTRRTLLASLGGLAVTACSKAAFFAVNVPAVFGAYTRHADIAYGDMPQQRLDVYVPQGPAGRPGVEGPQGVGGARLPVVVFWYGGRWSEGDKQDYRFVGAALASLGCVAVLPNYRHYSEVKLPGFMADAAQAGHWAAAHAGEFGGDAGRLYTMGHSAGAHMAALVTLDTRYFRANGAAVPKIAGLIGLSGPYDFLPITDLDLQDMFGPPDRYPLSQPIDFVRPDAPRALLIHGLADDSVWPKNTRNLASALGALGVPVTLKLYPRARHADTVAALSLPVRYRAPTLADIAAFIHA